jgi:hypothetical protein
VLSPKLRHALSIGVPVIALGACKGNTEGEREGAPVVDAQSALSVAKEIPTSMGSSRQAHTSTRPSTPAERRRVLEGIAELQAIVRRRTASIAHETEDGCSARMDRENALIERAQKKAGEEWLKRKTRFSGRAPDLGQDVIGVVYDCVLGCLLDDEADPGDKVGREMVTRSCGQAGIALGDVIREVGDSR